MSFFSESDLILNADGSVYHLSLKPQNVANNIIVVGDPGRVYRVSKHFDNVEFEMNKREFITHTGRYNKKPVTVMSTGMGVDNIEIAMIELDALFNIDLKKRVPKEKHTSCNLIRIGTSGAIQQDLQVGSKVISEYGIGLDNVMDYYQLQMSDFERAFSQKLKQEIEVSHNPYVVKCSEKLFQKFGDAFIKGNTITAPGFYAPQGRQLRIPVSYPKFLDQVTYFNFKDHWLTNFEMETSMLYGMARMLGHEAISINAILGNRVKKRFTKDPYEPVDAIIKKVLELL